MRAKKSLGQNFLMHARIAERIALVAHLALDATVLEIGPGTGMLTRELLKLAKKVIAIEADNELFEKLQTDFANEIASGHLELIHDDIRNYPHFSTTVSKWGYQVVANIPYYLTGEIFRMFLESENQPRRSSKSGPRPQASGPSSMTLLVQKEVADRIVARDGKESILSLSVKAYGTPKREFLVPRGAFKPAPNVDSAVLTVRYISRKNFASREEEVRFFALIHAGFAHKRKYVRNNLSGLVSEKALRDAGVLAGARAEDLSLNQWLACCR